MAQTTAGVEDFIDMSLLFKQKLCLFRNTIFITLQLRESWERVGQVLTFLEIPQI